MTNINKLAREISELTADEISELNGLLMHRYDISSNIYRFRNSSEPKNEMVESKSNNSRYDDLGYDVYLIDAGDTKLHLVKTIKEVFDIGLREAKDFIDNVPCCIRKGISKTDALEYKLRLEYAGGKVDIM